MSLHTYNTKRHFNSTPEPAARRKTLKKSKTLQFVVQRHDASHLHYDFRLEVNGVLKSWAIPKGPSMNPADKRLAVAVEDHPLAYGKFEGVIPEGNYGAGTVEIWDTGTYTPETSATDPQKEMEKQLRSGSIKIVLQGKKLKGSFALVRMKDGKNWLLIKHNDDFATGKEYNPEAGKENVVTTPEAAHVKKNTVTPIPRSVRSPHGEKFKHFIKPMLTQLHDKPFDDPHWIFEVKWDGYRAIAEITTKDVRLYSRNGLSFATLYPAVFNEIKKLKTEAVLDGEIVVMDQSNKPSFQKLQQYAGNPGLSLVYYVFDILSLKGKDLTELPLLERKKILKEMLPAKSEVIRYSDHVETSGTLFFEKIVSMEIEGMIAKRADSLYNPGRRTTDWLKIKHHNTQEAIIAGYTAPRGGRKYFGALVLGIRSGNNLRYIGHTGTGLTEKILHDVYKKLQPLIRKTSPFDKKIPVNATVTWVEPELVCEVKFSEITDEGIMRHPVFMGLRIDKSASEANRLDVAAKAPPKKSAASKRVPAKTASKTKRDDDGDDDNAHNKTVMINRHKLTLTNLNKLYWPEDQITKGDLIAYYNSIHQYILPYLKDRPQSLKRNPNGIGDKGFFQKDAGEAAPSWVKTITLYAESADKDINYILCNNEATLTYLNNLGCIEINPWNSTTRHLDKPDYMIMDIDPSDNNSFEEVIDTARVIKQILDKAKAVAYCKTSGASGLHIYVPLHAAYTYEQIRPFAELIAVMTQQELPAITTTERSLNKRKGRIYIDYLQNKRGQTLAAAYSARPVPGASVSTPLEWKEVKHGLHPSNFTIHNIKKRLDKKGDLFSGVLTEKIDLRKCIKALES